MEQRIVSHSGRQYFVLIFPTLWRVCYLIRFLSAFTSPFLRLLIDYDDVHYDVKSIYGTTTGFFCGHNKNGILCLPGFVELSALVKKINKYNPQKP